MSLLSLRDTGRCGAAVIGTGFIAAVHRDALRRIGVPLRGVLTRDAAAARRSGDYPLVYDDLESLCADPAVDVVHVTSPNHLHAKQVGRLIAAGKHIICEKPLALTSDEGLGMLRAAEAAGIVHAICFNVRFNPVLQEARAMVRRGDLGPPRLISGGYLQDWLLLDTDWNWRVDPAASGRLRAVADIGSHWLDLVRFVTGLRVTEVFADLHTFVPVRRRPTGSVGTFTEPEPGPEPEAREVECSDVSVTTDDAAGLLLRFDGGARGVLTVSQVSPGRKNLCTVDVSGARSGLSWNSEEPERLWVGHRGEPNHILLRDLSLMGPDAIRVSHLPGGHPGGLRRLVPWPRRVRVCRDPGRPAERRVLPDVR